MPNTKLTRHELSMENLAELLHDDTQKHGRHKTSLNDYATGYARHSSFTIQQIKDQILLAYECL